MNVVVATCAGGVGDIAGPEVVVVGDNFAADRILVAVGDYRLVGQHVP